MGKFIHFIFYYRISPSKFGGGLLHEHYIKKGKKNEIFQSLGVGDNTGMGDWMVKYGNISIVHSEEFELGYLLQILSKIFLHIR